jgi:hypothetical protein
VGATTIGPPTTFIALAVKSPVVENKKKYENVPVLRNVVPAQMLMGRARSASAPRISAYARNRLKAIAGMLDQG